MFVFVEKQYTENLALLIPRVFELFTRKVCKMFVYKHTEKIEYVKKWDTYFFRKIQLYWENNSIMFRNKNAKISGHYFYMN